MQSISAFTRNGNIIQYLNSVELQGYHYQHQNVRQQSHVELTQSACVVFLYIDGNFRAQAHVNEDKRPRAPALTFIPVVFSSPELRAQVSFSDRLMSVVRPSVCL